MENAQRAEGRWRERGLDRIALAHRWDPHALCELAAAALAEAEAEARLEQAIRGMDAEGERALQARLARAYDAAGYRTYREERYPGDRRRKRRSEGQRCDLVLAPPNRHLEREAAQHELFEEAGPRALVEEAMWIEVKTVAQYGPGGPNRAYASALQRPVWRDTERLASDERIHHAAQLVVLYTSSADVAVHDLGSWRGIGVALGLPLEPGVLRSLPIVDRTGNANCTVGWFARTPRPAPRPAPRAAPR